MVQVIRKIGNSQGVLLPKTLLQQVGIETAVTVEVVDGALVLRPAKSRPRSDWDKVFAEAVAKPQPPETDLWETPTNEFDETEWTW